MHVLAIITISAIAICSAGSIAIVYSVWKAELYPCEKCGLSPATHETAGQRELCESCYVAYVSELQPAVFSQPHDPGSLKIDSTNLCCLTPVSGIVQIGSRLSKPSAVAAERAKLYVEKH